VHSYYHFVPLVLSYCSMGDLSDSIGHSRINLSSSDLPTLVCFLIFHWLMRKHLFILADMMSWCITFSEAQRLARKCSTRRSDSLVRAL
jgi:hypothetical protein